ncbi:phage baseplate assembly protein V [Paenibacillaceae bacterium WGS1546]|uniref:phage baseplate assembly protein V n=1 Tax=Cohnella sp. WGS1546 TaxID=3366810 RepID=UPI00372D2AF8
MTDIFFDWPDRGSGVDTGVVNGVLIAVVTNIDDPDKLGRVKLKFTIRENEHETDWAPLASLMAGPDRGTLFIPEVGDEVLVAFHLGYLDQPFVIGGLWNQERKPPEKHEKNDIRKIRTRAGHELIFQDTDSDGKITLKTKDGLKLEISDKADSVTLATKNDQQSVTLTGGSSKKIEIKAGASTITLDNQGKITIESGNSVQLKATQVNLEATAQMSIKAGGTLDLKADGIVNIKGSMVKIN